MPWCEDEWYRSGEPVVVGWGGAASTKDGLAVAHGAYLLVHLFHRGDLCGVHSEDLALSAEAVLVVGGWCSPVPVEWECGVHVARVGVDGELTDIDVGPENSGELNGGAVRVVGAEAHGLGQSDEFVDNGHTTQHEDAVGVGDQGEVVTSVAHEECVAMEAAAVCIADVAAEDGLNGHTVCHDHSAASGHGTSREQLGDVVVGVDFSVVADMGNLEAVVVDVCLAEDHGVAGGIARSVGPLATLSIGRFCARVCCRVGRHACSPVPDVNGLTVRPDPSATGLAQGDGLLEGSWEVDLGEACL